MADPVQQFTAFDHTDLERRRKKLWNLAEGVPLTIVGGIDLRALVVAAVSLLALLGLLILLSPLPLIEFGLWTILFCVALAVGIYLLWPRRWRNGLTTEQNLLVAADFLFLQPRRIHGLAADVEPDVVHWQVILWQPGGRRWRLGLANSRAKRQLIRWHPDDLLLSESPAGKGSRNR
ncbi:hypothetical protein [Tenggerimyces flavus]|uniref:Uncharacterized protein n=1 Tax=Tenggerimyces flavus TaxID=1708749 RepID=A0ABV7YPF1_9ACTN|nr:hypothetical protein [Tenggerimyces flavus]MBM7784480.1 hypothetical protein [Tenggerimyces flavus]